MNKTPDIVKKRRARFDKLVKEGYLPPLDKKALYGHGGRFEPAFPPDPQRRRDRLKRSSKGK